jgi:serine-type D-Ala-D-Ala carboxypeptidase (penicillin-binding protein 5/6)
MTRIIFALFVLALFFAAHAWADPAIQTTAKQAFAIDYETGRILLEKNADERMPTS